MTQPTLGAEDLAGALFHFHPKASNPAARAGAIARACPDLERADPAGRGPGAAPCQWIADLVALSMASVHAKDGEGRVHPVAGPSRAWFLGLAAELSERFKPGSMLAFDGREPLDRLPLGGLEGQFKAPNLQAHPDLLSALVSGPHMRHPAPEAGASVARLIERCLEGVEISNERAREAIGDLIQSGHYESAWPSDKTMAPAQLRQAIQAILGASPSLTIDDLGWKDHQRQAWMGAQTPRALKP